MLRKRAGKLQTLEPSARTARSGERKSSQSQSGPDLGLELRAGDLQVVGDHDN